MKKDFFPTIFGKILKDTKIINANAAKIPERYSTETIITASTRIILRIETKELEPSSREVNTISERHVPRENISPEILKDKTIKKNVDIIKSAIQNYAHQLKTECKIGLDVYQTLKKDNPQQLNTEVNYASCLKKIIELAEKIRELLKNTVHSIAEKTETAKEELEEVLRNALLKLRNFNIDKEACIKLIQEGEQSTGPERISEILKELEPLQRKMLEEILEIGFSFHFWMGRYSPAKIENIELQKQKFEKIEEVYTTLKTETETALDFIKNHSPELITRKGIEKSLLDIHLLLTETESEYIKDYSELAKGRGKRICNTINRGNRIIKAKCKSKEIKNSFPPTRKYILTLRAGMLRRKLGEPIVIIEKTEGRRRLNNFYTYLDPTTINAMAKALTVNPEEAIKWVKNALTNSLTDTIAGSYYYPIIIKIKNITEEDLE